MVDGFLAGWMQVIVYGPAIIAAVGGFTGILIANFFNLDDSWRIPLSIGCMLFITIINFLDNKVGAAFSVITTIGKMIPIAAIIIFGIFWGQNNALGQTIADVKQSSGGFGVAVLATLFAYDGWILIANLGGEMKNPQKVLPQAIILGIIISMLGTLNGKIITFPRIVYAMAKRNDLPFSSYLTYLTPKGKSPIVATIFITVLATLMLVLFDSDRLSDLCVFTIYCFYILAFFGIFKLRRENSNRPFSTPLYPLVPIVAILGGLFIVVSELFNDPAGVVLFLGIVAVGLPIFYYLKRKEKISRNKAIEINENHD